MSSAIKATAVTDSPFAGLSYYTEKDSRWFFGRETERKTIIGNLRAARLTLLYAESGVGKSSILLAGVASRLRELGRRRLAERGSPQYVPVVFRAWKDEPADALIRGIEETIGEFLPADSTATLPRERLDEAIKAAAEAINATLLIILDQFEEYFLYRSREAEPGRFGEELARCVNSPDVHANFLIAIREDAYAGLGDLFAGQIANVYGNYLHLEYLDREAAREAIVRPIERYNEDHPDEQNVGIEPALVEEVLDQVRRGKLAYGQVGRGAVDGSNGAGRPGETTEGKIDSDQGADRRRDAIEGTVDSKHGADRHRDEIEAPFLQLVMTRLWDRDKDSHLLRLATLRELGEAETIVRSHLDRALTELADGELETAVDVFHHLVTPSGAKIAHGVTDLAKMTHHSEETVAAVLEKLDESRIVRRVEPSPDTHDERYEIFHDRLATPLLDWVGVRDNERLRREARAQTRRANAFRAVALVAVLLGVAAVFVWRLAVADRQTARSRQFAAAAVANLESDPQLSTRLALRALAASPTVEAEEALRQAFGRIQELSTVRARGPVYGVAISPDGTTVAAATASHFAEVWNMAQPTRPPIVVQARDTYLNAVAFSPNGADVVAAGGDGYVTVFTPSGTVLHSGPIADDARRGYSAEDVAFGPGSQTFATVDALGHLCLFVLPSAVATRCTREISARNPNGVTRHTALASVSFNRSGSLIATAVGNDGTWLWSTHGLKRIGTVPALGVNVTYAAFNRDGTELVTTSQQGSVRVWSVSSPLHPHPIASFDTVGFTSQAAFTPDGARLVTVNDLGQTTVWDIRTQTQLAQLNCHCGVVYGAAADPTGAPRVVTGSNDGTVRIWDALPRELQQSIRLNTPDVSSADFIPRSDGIAILESSHKRLVVWNLRTNQSGSVPAVDASFDRAKPGIFVTAEPAGGATIWSLITRKPQATQFTRGDGLTKVAVSPDGRWLAVADESGDAFIVPYPRGYGALLAGSSSQKTFLNSIAFDRSGKQVVIAYQNGKAVIWSTSILLKHLTSGQPKANQVGVCKLPADAVMFDAEFSPDGQHLVTADNRGNATIFDVAHPAKCRSLGQPLNAGSGQINTAEFNPSGTQILTSGDDGTARIWSVATHIELSVFGPAPEPVPAAVNSAHFNDGGSAVLTAGNDGLVRIWSTETTAPLAQLESAARRRAG